MLWLGLSIKKTFVMFGIKISVLAAKNTAGKICRYSLKHPVLSPQTWLQNVQVVSYLQILIFPKFTCT